MVYSINEHVVDYNNVGLKGATPLERFATHRTLKFRSHATFVLKVLDNSFLILVRPAASVRAHKSGYCNHKR